MAKTTVVNAEKGRQEFNYKLLFWLIVRHGVNPTWLILGEDHSRRVFTADFDLVTGRVVKDRPDAMDKIQDPELKTGWLYFPTEWDKGLVNLLKRIEKLYMGSTAEQRKTIERLVGIIEDFRSGKS